MKQNMYLLLRQSFPLTLSSYATTTEIIANGGLMPNQSFDWGVDAQNYGTYFSQQIGFPMKSF